MEKKECANIKSKKGFISLILARSWMQSLHFMVMIKVLRNELKWFIQAWNLLLA